MPSLRLFILRNFLRERAGKTRTEKVKKRKSVIGDLLAAIRMAGYFQKRASEPPVTDNCSFLGGQEQKTA